MWNSRIAFLFLLTAGASGQTSLAPVVNGTSPAMVSWCGARADQTIVQAANVVAFDSPKNITCSAYAAKPSYPTLVKYDIYSTDGTVPSDTADSGVSKANVTSGARVASGGIIDDDASVGNPILVSNGGIIFLGQRAANVSQDSDPGEGQGYDVYACKALPCTSANAAVVLSQTAIRALCSGTPAACTNGGGFDYTTAPMIGALDPHFYPWDPNTAYVSVLEFSRAQPAWCTDTQCIPLSWAIYTFTIDWSGTAPALATITGRWTPGDFATYTGSLVNECSKYYKASGVRKESDGSVTMYTQIDQVAMNPHLNVTNNCVGRNCNDPCYAIGATLRQSGLASFTLASPPAGTNYVQLAPLSWQRTEVVNGEYRPYFEFPLLILGQDPTVGASANSNKMLVISNANTDTLGKIISANAANQHDDYYVLDIDKNTLTAVTNADTYGSAWNLALRNSGTFRGMAHGGYNPYNKTLVTRVVTGISATDNWVIKIPMDYSGNPLLEKARVTGKARTTGKARF